MLSIFEHCLQLHFWCYWHVLICDSELPTAYFVSRLYEVRAVHNSIHNLVCCTARDERALQINNSQQRVHSRIDFFRSSLTTLRQWNSSYLAHVRLSCFERLSRPFHRFKRSHINCGFSKYGPRSCLSNARGVLKNRLRSMERFFISDVRDDLRSVETFFSYCAYFICQCNEGNRSLESASSTEIKSPKKHIYSWSIYRLVTVLVKNG